jgi:signal peptidase I
MPRWLELILIVLIALALAAVTKTFFVQSFFVPSGSMRPLLHGSELTDSDDRIVVEKVSYWNDDVHRGDVVVFDDSQDWLHLADVPADSGPLQATLEAVGLWPTGGHLVKRVIGLPGDTVACCDASGRVTVNGVALDETDYLPKGAEPSQLPFSVTVPADHLWVMGDNRQNSEDSRAHQQEPGRGFVPVDDVVGKVMAIVWPADRASLVHRPDTFDNPKLDG